MQYSIKQTLSVIASISATVNAGSFCTSDKALCIISTPGSADGTLLLTVISKAKGWVGFGIGTSMADADVFMMTTVNGKPVITDRTASTEAQPTIDSVQDVHDASNEAFAIPSQFDTTGATIYKFWRPIVPTTGSQNKLIKSGLMDIIYAYSDSPLPSQHSTAGSATLVFFDAGASPPVVPAAPMNTASSATNMKVTVPDKTASTVAPPSASQGSSYGSGSTQPASTGNTQNMAIPSYGGQQNVAQLGPQKCGY